ncbi:DNA excision repair protein ERCC-6-like 2 [Python bivittatus]|uniref:DNA excision repair protein ERCC-6-like 2 n=1 Tax=Python bivittatus TaxID=176946 RepID=A0A9F5IZA5_PYTBI|nr:DNA excision repair protein ERCC-6-like 2 [Python bivittatus]
MKILQKLLNHFRKNKDKVLLFSFSTKLLDILEQYCMASGLDYRRLDGNTKAEDRVKIVKEFNSMEEVSICLVSTMAGGLGLNFVGANIVILFDPTWNPANDLQAIDRVYRIGQRRDVKVFRLISLGTVEEMMYLRQVYKQQLHCVVIGSKNAKRYFKAVQGSKEHQGELFGIHNLFRFQDHGSCLTKEILEREGQVEAGVMTAATWLKEGSRPHEETECDYEDQDTKPLEKEGLDCYSDFSDEEHERNSKVQAVRNRNYKAKHTKVPQEQLSLLQCGFPKLLEKKTRTAEGGDHTDNVAEVPYVHSNQDVVGSSKAENQMSHWAARDVFELQQFSQLPANIAVCRAKKSRESPEDVSSRRKNVKKDHLASKTSRPSLLYITHPVHQKQKGIHQIDSITFLLGKTPRQIRRKQFGEMANLFHKAPVEEFAKYITQATSEERQKMLKEFYSAKYPELKDLLKVDVPASVSKGSKKGSVYKTKFRKKNSICNHGQLKPDPSTDLGDPGTSDAEEKQFQYKLSVQTAGGQNEEDKQLPVDTLKDSISGRNSQASKDFMASESLISKSRIIERLSASSTKGQPNLKGTLSPKKLFMSESESRQAQICKKNAVADLLGDTSILNDLFKSNENSPAEIPRRPLNGPAEKAATRPKDFWDMLNEENEECLQRLTDVTAIEKLCERVPFASLSKEKEEGEKSLWKENDSFLWKIDKKPDTADESFSGI